jgi:hypothetical protein
MTDDNDPDRLRGPGGLTLREIHDQVKRSAERDRAAAGRSRAEATRPQSRWQRLARYAWGRSGRR